MAEQDTSTRDRILTAARNVVQARGYGGLSFRDLAAEVGIKAASVYHYFPSKADLGAAVARRYWQDTAAALQSLSVEYPGAHEALREYPRLFRQSLESNNRMCLCSFMAAEYDELPIPVRAEVQNFVEVNVDWLASTVREVPTVDDDQSEHRARAIYAAVAGAQLIARSRCDIGLYDSIVDGYRSAGLIPA